MDNALPIMFQGTHPSMEFNNMISTFKEILPLDKQVGEN